MSKDKKIPDYYKRESKNIQVGGDWTKGAYSFIDLPKESNRGKDKSLLY
jgi:hypothetical protein